MADLEKFAKEFALQLAASLQPQSALLSPFHTSPQSNQSQSIALASSSSSYPLFVDSQGMLEAAPHVKKAEFALIEKKMKATPKVTGQEHFRVDPISEKRIRQIEQKKAKSTTGGDWFNMPETELTPEMKKDLAVVAMRDALSSSRWYKKDKMRDKYPKFSQVGTVVVPAEDYFSSRLTKKQKQQTITQEIMHDAEQLKQIKRKYGDIQEKNNNTATIATTFRKKKQMKAHNKSQRKKAHMKQK